MQLPCTRVFPWWIQSVTTRTRVFSEEDTISYIVYTCNSEAGTIRYSLYTCIYGGGHNLVHHVHGHFGGRCTQALRVMCNFLLLINQLNRVHVRLRWRVINLGLVAGRERSRKAGGWERLCVLALGLVQTKRYFARASGTVAAA